jgi:hypothetical protein
MGSALADRVQLPARTCEASKGRLLSRRAVYYHGKRYQTSVPLALPCVVWQSKGAFFYALLPMTEREYDHVADTNEQHM